MSEHEPRDERTEHTRGHDSGPSGRDAAYRNARDGGHGRTGAGRRGLTHNWWWLAGGIVGAILVLTLITPMTSPYRSPGPTPSPLSPPLSPSPTPAGGNLKVLGFYDETGETTTPSALDILAANRGKIDYFSPFWYKVESDGTLSSRMEDDSHRVVSQANIPTVPLYNNAAGNETVINDPATRSKAIQSIVDNINQNQWAGCNIDFQLLSASAREGLTAFMKELRAKMPAGKVITMSVMPFGQAENQRSPYNYTELSKYVDQLVLMTYDKHSDESDPGPVAPIAWVEDNIKAALTEGIPASKIYLGVATYGYDWKTGAQQTATVLPMKQIPVEKTDAHSYDAKNQSAYHTYTDSSGVKHEMWWEDEKSLGPKVDLAKKYGLYGIAVWRVGYEDQGWWDSLGKLLNR